MDKVIVCFDCLNLNDAFEEYNLEVDDIENLLMIVGYKNSGNLQCIECEELLETSQLYFESIEDKETFVESALYTLGKNISKEIKFCSNCHEGKEIEEYCYRMEKEFNDEFIRGAGTELPIFLGECKISEEYQEKILKFLRCQSCKCGEAYHPKHNPDGREFKLFEDNIYSLEEINGFWGYDDYEELSKFAKMYGIELSNDEILEFREYIYQKPLMAYKNEVGQALFRVLQEHFTLQEYEILKKGTILFRGRNRGCEETPFKIENLWNPPEGVSTHGRFNSIGVSVLYCSDDYRGIPVETHPTITQMIDIAEVLVNKDLKILNIDKLFENFNDLFSEINHENKGLKRAYLLTNFIKDCCSEIGFNGISYKGVRSAKYTNYALFNFTQNYDLQLKDSFPLTIDIEYTCAK